MANHPSAIKRHRESLKRQTRNRWWKSRVHHASKQVVDAASKKDKKLASKVLVLAAKEIGKAKSKGVIHRNNASRKIARLSKIVAAI